MDYLIVSIFALVVSALTFFSGFGLGTLLMPVFALFFDVEIAIAATALVHLANNIFKVALVGKRADFKIVLLFAMPAAVAAVGGALLLQTISNIDPLYVYHLLGRECSVTVVKVIIALLIGIFSTFELLPMLQELSFDKKYIPLGGVLSGFFGGLSGHQGALRTAFLIQAGLNKNAFIGTMVVSAVLVDISRLTVYGATFFSKHFSAFSAGGGAGLVIVACMAAFVGSLIGRQLLTKVTMKAIQLIVGVMLLMLAIALGAGIV